MVIRVSEIGISAFMSQRGPQIETEHRIKASYFLGGKMNKEGASSLICVIQRHRQIRSIVAERRAAEARNSYLFHLLGKLGFTETKVGDDVVVFIKATSEK